MSWSTWRRGQVIETGGRPVPGAHVVIVAGSVPMPEIALACDGNGRFSLSLPPGTFTLRAHGPTGIGEVEVEGGTADDEILITIGR